MALNILVTGADGFVGSAVCPALAAAGHRVRRAVRAAPPGAAGTIAVGDIGPGTDWSPAVDGIDAIVHLAGRAHVMADREGDPLAAYRRVNVDGTRGLAESAARAGVRRLVMASSIKVNGEASGDRPCSESDAPTPRDAYGVSKLEAEVALREIAARTGLEAVVVRPPLVHGPGVKGNLARLIAAVARGVPLPLGAIDNRRSLVGVANLAEALRLCIEHPAAAGEVFLVRDGEDVSTPALVRAIAAALGRSPRLVPVPPWALRLAGRLAGRSAAVERLLGSLRVDDTRIRARLGYRPVCGFADGIAAMVRTHPAAREVSRGPL